MSGVGAPRNGRAPDKDSHGPLPPQAAPAEADELSATDTTPGAHNPESSARPRSRKPIITDRTFAAKSGLKPEIARIAVDYFLGQGWWELYGVLEDGTITYTLGPNVPPFVIIGWDA